MKDLSENERKAIMGKLEKILAHTGDGAVNENEIETANKLAKSIMERYGITEAEIIKCDDKADLIAEEFVSRISLAKKRWVSLLGGTIARFYECSSLSNSLRFMFIGYKLDAAIAAKMFKETHEKILSQSKTIVGVNSGNTIERRRNFCLGAVIGLQRKLHAIADERLRSQNALVVLKEHIIDDYMDEEYPSLRKAGTVKISNTSDYHVGQSYGETIGINREIKAEVRK